MKLKQWTRIILIGCSMLTLAACSSHRQRAGTDVNDANAAYNGAAAQTSGTGEESTFGDQAGGAAAQASLSRRTYYFDFDSNVVHQSDRPAIEANARYLNAHSGAKVMLEGHTDPRGSREYNIGLGERRAKAVAEVLMAKGVNPEQIRVVSYGAEKLATPGHSEADYQRDRRVVLVYLQR